MADFDQYIPVEPFDYVVKYPAALQKMTTVTNELETGKAAANHVHDTGDPPLFEVTDEPTATGTVHAALSEDGKTFRSIDTDGSEIGQMMTQGQAILAAQIYS